jgi:hypothetical protein
MKKMVVDLKNCYGIKSLHHEFDFSSKRVCAIYAANGSMKSSLAQTFKDVADGSPSTDRMFPKRPTTRTIADEAGVPLPPESILVLPPYDESMGTSEKTSTLLVDATLRAEYEKLHVDIDIAKSLLLKALKEQSGSKKDLEREISEAFTSNEDQLYIALTRVLEEVTAQKDAPFASIDYDKLFDDKVLSLLSTKDVKTALADYIKRYNELLDASTYFKRGTFNYYNAATIAKALAEHGFFDAKHTVNLNADKSIEITSQKQLEELIAKEKEGISSDPALRKRFAELDKLIQKNATVRTFELYLAAHEEILPKLTNMNGFRQEIWKSYFKVHFGLYSDVVTKYRAAEKRRREIEEAAGKQRTQWESVIDIFNSRFFVPFRLEARNKVSVVLGAEPILSLGFIFEDSGDTVAVERGDLIRVLSNGEKKALYVLNIIFEIETRKKAAQKTVFVVDDIADSFDYKNKYAIVQYLMEIADAPSFYQVILTHNFDFFRTVQSRFVPYANCFMASKSSAGIALPAASGIRNVFAKDWKLNFFSDPMKRIACIPFMRNLIEYIGGETDPRYIKLTSLLHFKSDSPAITEDDLDEVYISLFGGTGKTCASGKPVLVSIHEEAKKCLGAAEGVNFENKIVLSVALRMAAEEFMVKRIGDSKFVDSIKKNQTSRLQSKFRELFGGESVSIDILQQVLLMTPENIHLNSFMYEPILDMSDDHLRRLYVDVMALR